MSTKKFSYFSTDISGRTPYNVTKRLEEKGLTVKVEYHKQNGQAGILVTYDGDPKNWSIKRTVALRRIKMLHGLVP